MLCCNEGYIYEGEFVNNEYDGIGQYKNNNGDSYIGQFKANEFHGKVNIDFTLFRDR